MEQSIYKIDKYSIPCLEDEFGNQWVPLRHLIKVVGLKPGSREYKRAKGMDMVWVRQLEIDTPGGAQLMDCILGTSIPFWVVLSLEVKRKKNTETFQELERWLGIFRKQLLKS